MTNKNNDKADLRAVIYCRVSSTRQKTEGGGLDSQEHRCRQYAVAHGYDVEAVCQRRSKIGPRGGAKPGHLGIAREVRGGRRPVSRALHVAGG